MNNLIKNFEEPILDSFMKFKSEWETGIYSRYSQCPSYGQLRTLVDSVNCLNDYEGRDRVTINDMFTHWN